MHPPHQFKEILTPNLYGQYVRDIVQDPRGFIWIATQGGVVRFDGHETRPLPAGPASSAPLKGLFGTALEIGHDGKLWVGTGDAGLLVHDPDTGELTRYRAGETAGLTSDGITALHRDQSGAMWVGLDDGKVAHFDPAAGAFATLQVFDPAKASPIASIASGDGTRVWIASHGDGVAELDAASKKVLRRLRADDDQPGPSSDDVNAIYMDRHGLVWMGTTEGLDRLDPKTGVVTRYRNRPGVRNSLSDNVVTDLLETADGTLWIGCGDGMNALSPNREAFTRYTRDPAYPIITASFPYSVTTIYYDRGGVLWVGITGGLFTLDTLRLGLGKYLNSATEGDRIGFAEAEGGVLWTGSLGTGLQAIDRRAGRVTMYTRLGSPGDPGSISLKEWITTVHYDRGGKVWFGGTKLGLVWLDPATDRYKRYSMEQNGLDGPSVDHIRHIAATPDGTLWLATWGGGLNRFNPRDQSFEEFSTGEDDSQGIGSDYLFHIKVDRSDDDVLWLGTARGGLSRFQISSGTAKNFRVVPEGVETAGDGSVLTIHQDGDGILWLGTDGSGLVKFDPGTGKVEYFDRDGALAGGAVYGIVEDGQGKLWLSTQSEGLYVFDRVSAAFTQYTTRDGLLGNVFDQNAYFKTSAGELVFSSRNGVHIFRPDAFVPDPQFPPVALTSVKIFDEEPRLGRPLSALRSLGLGYEESVFSFEFTALSYAAPEAIRYAYKMDGLHDWIETNRRFVTYSRLDHGDYTFRVKATNRDGEWGDNQVSLRIHVDPPPWKTWWAYALYTVAGLALVLAIVRYQSEKIAALRQAHRLEAAERDIALAAAVQTGILPPESEMKTRRFHLSSYYRAAATASGDWWWYEHAKDDHLIVVIGDVTGHGPGPAMVTVGTASTFRSHPSPDIATRLADTNAEVMRIAHGEFTVAITVVELHGRTGKFVIYGAGLPPAMIVGGGAPPRAFPCPGTPLGISASRLSIGRIHGRLAPGERMILFTDGIMETALPNGRQFGLRRLSQLCHSMCDRDLTQMTKDLVRSIDALRAEVPQEDDWTLVSVQWNGPRGGAADEG